jgi:NADH:ubiquinone oxidoreductase subunit F (NADH-binding)
MKTQPKVVLSGDRVLSLADYVARGGGEGLKIAQILGPRITAKEVSLSGLRGRGGGGFRTGRKWMSVQDASQEGDRRYVVCNGAEGEPGTFKDRAILRHNPYQVIEGLAIAASTIKASGAYLAVKSTFSVEIRRVESALREMRVAGLAGDIPITLVRGPDSYLFGEEKALLEVVEGEEPLPRRDAPYLQGLFAPGPQMGWSAHATAGQDRPPAANPTVVNNVETLATVPHVLTNGPEWYRSMGTAESPGTMVFTVVGDVVHPGYEEVELGTPLGEIIERIGGGAAPGRAIKAVFSGVSNGVISAEHLDVPASYEGLKSIGSGLGAAGFMVYDDTADMVSVARMFSRFLHVESCGQCGACKINSGEIAKTLERLENGGADERDINNVASQLKMVTDQSRCYLPEELQVLVRSILKAFPEDFVDHLERQLKPRRTYQLPKIVDLQGGQATYDERINYKQPDWTYLNPPLAG